MNEILLRCPLFQGIQAHELDAVLGCLGAKTERFRKGDAILAEEEPQGGNYG